jgi:ribosomal protein S18 acetylase RimI-like enzyme
VSARFEVRRFAPDLIEPAAELLAERHARHRATWPALDPAYEDSSRCAPLIEERLGQDGAVGAMAFADGQPRGYLLMTPRPENPWGPSAWAEDVGSAGGGEAIRESYASIAGELVEAGRKGHWAMVPSSDVEMNDAYFSLSFGLQQIYAYREPVRADFRPTNRDGLVIRRAEERDVRALAELDLVLPSHVMQSPVFSKLNPPSLEDAMAELAEDVNNPKYAIWVAEHEGRIISEMVGCAIGESSSWSALMQPPNTGLLAYAATYPHARGLGAGRALTDTFMAWARDEGYDWLATDWRSTNLEANRTWRAMGFRPGFNRLFRAIP